MTEISSSTSTRNTATHPEFLLLDGMMATVATSEEFMALPQRKYYSATAVHDLQEESSAMSTNSWARGQAMPLSVLATEGAEQQQQLTRKYQ
jgi:hypothetical protein